MSKRITLSNYQEIIRKRHLKEQEAIEQGHMATMDLIFGDQEYIKEGNNLEKFFKMHDIPYNKKISKTPIISI